VAPARALALGTAFGATAAFESGGLLAVGFAPFAAAVEPAPTVADCLESLGWLSFAAPFAVPWAVGVEFMEFVLPAAAGGCWAAVVVLPAETVAASVALALPSP
jgi:hypothetical protein